MTFSPDTGLINRYVSWIEQFDIRHAQLWAKLFWADAQAAMCEASTWGLLTDCGVTVEPNAKLDGSTKAPDFFCRKDDYEFYVEATCLHIDTVTAKTALEHHPTTGFQSYSDLTDSIFWECQQKTPQCAAVDGPCLVCVVTFHSHASMVCVEKCHLGMLLTGEQLMAWDINLSRGDAVGDPYGITRLRSAAFLKPLGIQVVSARSPVSGIIVAGLGVSPPNVYGLLHPDPNHPFDPSMVDRIEFGRLAEDYNSGNLRVVWA